MIEWNACAWYSMSMASLPSIRITSEICLLTATLADKDNPSSDALLSDNSKLLLLKGGKSMSHGSYSERTCLVSKSHSQNANINWNTPDVMQLYWSLGDELSICLVNTLGLYVNTSAVQYQNFYFDTNQCDISNIIRYWYDFDNNILSKTYCKSFLIYQCIVNAWATVCLVFWCKHWSLCMHFQLFWMLY